MHKIIYLIKRIFKLDYSNMFKIAKNISKKAKKPRLFIVLDMIYCGIVFQAGYYDYQEFEFYNLNNKQRKTYLTRGKNNEIVRTFNDPEYFHFIDNKIDLHKKFDKYMKRDWLCLENNNVDEFVEFFSKHKDIIVKPVDAGGGYGVEKYSFTNEKEARELYTKLVENEQFLIEECIKQHKDMNVLYDKSVNTLRMFTFLKDDKAYFLQAVLKIGNGGVVDNFSSGGMYTYVDDNGVVFVKAIDQADNIFDVHPISKTPIVGFKVPMFDEAVELVKECAHVVPQVAYIGWDVAIGENGPEIIEGNAYPGVFQIKSSLSDKKEGLIPKYNEIMNIF